MQGDQITPEVAHHAFFYWIRGYYSAAQTYIEAAQRAEPSNWEFVKSLFTITSQIEQERVKKNGKPKVLLDADEITKFLDEEIALEHSNPTPSATVGQQRGGTLKSI